MSQLPKKDKKLLHMLEEQKLFAMVLPYTNAMQERMKRAFPIEKLVVTMKASGITRPTLSFNVHNCFMLNVEIEEYVKGTWQFRSRCSKHKPVDATVMADLERILKDVLEAIYRMRNNLEPRTKAYTCRII